MSDSLREYHHGIAAERLALLIKRSADLADIPLTTEQADSLRRELVKSLPDLLDMVASASEGRVG